MKIIKVLEIIHISLHDLPDYVRPNPPHTAVQRHLAEYRHQPQGKARALHRPPRPKRQDFRLCLCAAIGDGALQRLRHVPLGCEQPQTAAQCERRHRRHERTISNDPEHFDKMNINIP